MEFDKNAYHTTFYKTTQAGLHLTAQKHLGPHRIRITQEHTRPNIIEEEFTRTHKANYAAKKALMTGPTENSGCDKFKGHLGHLHFGTILLVALVKNDRQSI